MASEPDCTFEDFLTEGMAKRHTQTELRDGQYWHNLLRARNPELSRLLVISRMADVDPYHDDRNMPTFFQFCQAFWNQEDLPPEAVDDSEDEGESWLDDEEYDQ